MGNNQVKSHHRYSPGRNSCDNDMDSMMKRMSRIKSKRNGFAPDYDTNYIGKITTDNIDQAFNDLRDQGALTVDVFMAQDQIDNIIRQLHSIKSDELISKQQYEADKLRLTNKKTMDDFEFKTLPETSTSEDLRSPDQLLEVMSVQSDDISNSSSYLEELNAIDDASTARTDEDSVISELSIDVTAVSDLDDINLTMNNLTITVPEQEETVPVQEETILEREEEEVINLDDINALMNDLDITGVDEGNMEDILDELSTQEQETQDVNVLAVEPVSMSKQEHKKNIEELISQRKFGQLQEWQIRKYMTVAQLKIILGEKSMRKSGNKQELIDRYLGV